MTKELIHLFPFNEKHSISEVVITFHLSKKINDPQDFVKKFKLEFQEFQEVGITFSQGIQLQIDEKYLAKINSSDQQIEGFFAKKLNNSNKLNLFIQNINLPTGEPILSFHFLEYIRFEDFLKNFSEIIEKLSNLDLFIVKAIGLTYVDLFEWRSNLDLPLVKIFNKKNKYFSENFFCYIGNFSIDNSGIVKKNNEQEYIEKIQIRAGRKSETSVDLQIIHNIVLDLKKQVLLNSLLDISLPSSLNKILTVEHQLNKDFLNNVLSKNVKTKIQLTNE